MLSIFCPYRNRKEFFDDFIDHYRNYYPASNIYMLEQKDNALFKRGQLMNVAFSNLLKMGVYLDNILFVDVDIRLKYRIRFEELLQQNSTVVIPFNHLDLYQLVKTGEYQELNQKSYFLDTPDGGATLFDKDMFSKCNGFSNMYIGWGREDSDFVRRNKVVRVPNTMLHLEHPRNNEWKSAAFKKNDTNFKLGSVAAFDGYRQSTGDFNMEPIEECIFHCTIKNIGVIKEYKYKSRL